MATLSQFNFREKFNYNSGVFSVFTALVFSGFVTALLFVGLKGTATPGNTYFEQFWSQVILGPDSPSTLHKPWALFTYMFLGLNFFEMVANILWLFLFGGLLENLIGGRKVLPLFITSGLIGAFLLLIFGFISGDRYNVVGPQMALWGIGTAFYFIAPKYRFYFTRDFSVPFYVLLLIFSIFVILSISEQPSVSLVLAYMGVAVLSWFYIKSLKNGLDWFSWINTQKGNPEKIKEELYITDDERLDDILDKINRKGIKSLSKNEKYFLDTYNKK